MKKLIVALVLMVLFFPSFPVYANEKEQPDIHGNFGIAMDARTGEVYYDKNAKERAYPASITKMITAMLLDEYVEDGEEMIVSEFAAGQEASNQHFKLVAGEKITKENAMKALMLISANDVAVTIAEHIGTTQEDFALLMTEKAKEIGADETNFVTASGLHDSNHYTTAYDMALIAKEVLEHPKVLAVMGTDTATVETNERSAEITNPSKIHDNPIAIGGKTGYTNAAQNTLVEILEKDNKLVIAVVMKTTLAEEYNDIEIMGNHAFDQMNEPTLYMEKGEVVQTKTIQKKELSYVVEKDVYVEEATEVTQHILEKDISANIKKGDVIGNLRLEVDGKVIQQIPLLALEELNVTKNEKIDGQKDMKNGEKDLTSSFSVFNLFMSILIPFVLYILYIFYYNRKKHRDSEVR